MSTHELKMNNSIFMILLFKLCKLLFIIVVLPKTEIFERNVRREKRQHTLIWLMIKAQRRLIWRPRPCVRSPPEPTASVTSSRKLKQRRGTYLGEHIQSALDMTCWVGFKQSSVGNKIRQTMRDYKQTESKMIMQIYLNDIFCFRKFIESSR